jgi:hypothetical protein
MPHNYEILPVKDQNHKKIVKKDLLFDLPMRVLAVAKTGQGKGVWILNALLRPEPFYGNDFEGEDIYLFSPSIRTDKKTQLLIKNKKIPNTNLYESLEEESLSAVLDFIQEQYEEAVENNEPIKHSMIVIDDCMPDMKRKQSGAFQDLFIRSRHFCCSVISTLQFYNKCPPVCRNNASGIIIYEVNNKQMDDVISDHSYLDNKKDFMKMYRKAVSPSKHSFMVINYSNPKDLMYLDSSFDPIVFSDSEEE